MRVHHGCVVSNIGMSVACLGLSCIPTYAWQDSLWTTTNAKGQKVWGMGRCYMHVKLSQAY